MYSFLIAHTAGGIVKSSCAPSEQFTPEAIESFLEPYDNVDGWEVLEIGEPDTELSNVVYVEF